MFLVTTVWPYSLAVMISYCTKFILTLHNIPLPLYLQYTTVFIQYSLVVLCIMFWNVHQSSSFPWQQLKFETVKSLMYVPSFLNGFTYMVLVTYLKQFSYPEQQLTRVYVSWLKHYISISSHSWLKQNLSSAIHLLSQLLAMVGVATIVSVLCNPSQCCCILITHSG